MGGYSQELNTDTSCSAAQIPMTSSTNLTYIFGEWIGTMCLEKYLLSGIMWSLLALVAVPVWLMCCVFLSTFIALMYDKIVVLNENSSNGCFLILAHLWDSFGRIWHGYELHGTENLPEGPGLIVYYHGALSIDYILFLAKLYLVKKRICHSVVDRLALKIPGFQRPMEKLFMICTKEACLSSLKCNLLGVSPGGVREALFSDKNYRIIWAKRTGFAHVAIDAKVPIIPMFTQNMREGYRTLGKIEALRKIYDKFRITLPFLYGGFPVKLRTYIGEPIPYDPNITAEELTKKANIALQTLIDKHQKRPGNIGRALLERFQNHRKSD